MQVKERQKQFLAPNYVSLAEAYLELVAGSEGVPFAMFAICNESEPVGFAMIYYLHESKKALCQNTSFGRSRIILHVI